MSNNPFSSFNSIGGDSFKSKSLDSFKPAAYEFNDDVSRAKENFYIQYGGAYRQIDAIFIATTDVSATVFINSVAFTPNSPIAQQYSLSKHLFITVYDRDGRSKFNSQKNQVELKLTDHITIIFTNRNRNDGGSNHNDGSGNGGGSNGDDGGSSGGSGGGTTIIYYNCYTNRFQTKGSYTIYQNTRTLIKNLAHCYFAEYELDLNEPFVKTLSSTRNVFLHSRESVEQIQHMINALSRYNFDALGDETSITCIFTHLDLNGASKLTIPNSFNAQFSMTADGKQNLIIDVKNKHYCYQQEQTIIITSKQTSHIFKFDLLTEQYTNESETLFAVTESVPLFNKGAAIKYRIEVLTPERKPSVDFWILRETINKGSLVLSKVITTASEITTWFGLIEQLDEAVKTFQPWYGSLLYIIQIADNIKRPNHPTTNLRFDWVSDQVRVLAFEYTRNHTHFHRYFWQIFNGGRLILSRNEAEMDGLIHYYRMPKVYFLENFNTINNVVLYASYPIFSGQFINTDDAYFKRKANVFLIGRSSNHEDVSTYINIMDALYKARFQNNTEDFFILAAVTTELTQEMLPIKFPLPIQIVRNEFNGYKYQIYISRGPWQASLDVGFQFQIRYRDQLIMRWREPTDVFTFAGYVYIKRNYYRGLPSQEAMGVIYRQ